MDLQKLINHHRHETEYWQRRHAHVAAEFHAEAAAKLEEIERFGLQLLKGATS